MTTPIPTCVSVSVSFALFHSGWYILLNIYTHMCIYIYT